MSTLWNVEVAALADREVTLRVVSVHPDAGPFRTDSTFALRLLFEPAQEFDDDFEVVGTGPLGHAATEDEVLTEKWAEQNAGRFVASVRVEEPDLPWDAPVGAIATYVIEATEPRWLEHLHEGQRWRSAAFS